MDNYLSLQLGNLHFGVGKKTFEFKPSDAHDKAVEEDYKRFEFASFQTHKLLGLMQMADSKAQFILGANTVLITVLFISFPNVRDIFLNGTLPVKLIYAGFLISFIVAALISMILAFSVVYPRHTPVSQADSYVPLLYFREIALTYQDAKEYSQTLASASQKEILISAGREIYNISVGANRKFTILQSSTRWLTVSVVLWALALSASLLFFILI